MRLKKFIFISLIFTLLLSLSTYTLLNNNKEVEAEEDETISIRIAACNLSFEDSVKIEYAVEAIGITDYENIHLYNYESFDDYCDVKNEYELKYLGIQTINDKDYCIFIDDHVAAKQMTVDFYTWGDYCVGDTHYALENKGVFKYSILQYVKNIRGTSNSTEEFDNLLDSMLVYGTNTQKYFEYNLDRLANDTYYELELIDGGLIDQSNHGLYKANEEVTIYPILPDFKYWLNCNGNTIYSLEDELTITINSDLKLKAIGGLPGVDGLLYELNDDEVSYSLAGIGTCTDKDIVVPKTYNNLPVTNILEHAFYNDDNITSITLQDSITNIESAAIYGCSKLEYIYIPNSITSLDKSDISNCSNLSYLIMEDTTTLPDSFDNLPLLRKVFIEQTTIDTDYLDDYSGSCYIFWLTYSYDNSKFLDDYYYWNYVDNKPNICDYQTDGLYFSLNDTNDAYELVSMNLYQPTDVYIPAFYKGLPVEKIDIYGKKNIVGLYIGKNVKEIASQSFAQSDPLRIVKMCDSVVNIGASCFEECYYLELVYLSNSLKTIPDFAFKDCIAIKEIIIPEGVTSIGSRAFEGCETLKRIVLPSTLKSIGATAFAECPNLCEILYNGTSEEFNEITIGLNNPEFTENMLYYYNDNWNYEKGLYWAYESGSPEILIDKRYIFEDKKISYLGDDSSNVHVISGINSQDSDIVIPAYDRLTKVLGISEGGLSNNQIIESVSFAGDLLYIDNKAFYRDTKLESIVLPKSLIFIGESAFATTPIKEIIIPENVVSIGKNIFDNCPFLEKVYILGDLEELPGGMFNGSINVTELLLPSSVKNIRANALSSCENLSIYYMGSEADFKNITIDESNNISNCNIYYYSETYPSGSDTNKYWHYVNGVVTRYVPSSEEMFTFKLNTEEDEYTITSYNGSEKVVHVPETYNGKNVTRIGDKAFINTPITNVYLPQTIKSLGENCFALSANLKEIYLPNSITDIGELCFSECTSLDNVKLPINLEVIPPYMFSRCTSLKNIEMSSDVLSIGQYAFSLCVSLEGIYISSSLNSLGKEAFMGCTKLKSITLPATLTSIGNYVFKDDTALESIYYEGSIEDFEGITIDATCNTDLLDKIFYYSELYNSSCENNNCWHYMGGIPTLWVTSQGLEFSFDKISSTYILTSLGTCTDKIIIIPASYNDYPVESISADVFKNNDNVEVVYFPSSIERLNQYQFNGCDNLTTVYLPTNLTILDGNIFSDCSNLNKVVIPDTVEEILDNISTSCNNLTELYYLGTPTEFENIEGYTHLGEYTIYYYSDVEIDGKYFTIANGAVVKW